MAEARLEKMARLAVRFHRDCDEAQLTNQDRMALIAHIAIGTLMTQFSKNEDDRIVAEFTRALSKSLADYRKTSAECHRLWTATV